MCTHAYTHTRAHTHTLTHTHTLANDNYCALQEENDVLGTDSNDCSSSHWKAYSSHPLILVLVVSKDYEILNANDLL